MAKGNTMGISSSKSGSFLLAIQKDTSRSQGWLFTLTRCLLNLEPTQPKLHLLRSSMLFSSILTNESMAESEDQAMSINCPNSQKLLPRRPQIRDVIKINENSLIELYSRIREYNHLISKRWILSFVIIETENFISFFICMMTKKINHI